MALETAHDSEADSLSLQFHVDVEEGSTFRVAATSVGSSSAARSDGCAASSCTVRATSCSRSPAILERRCSPKRSTRRRPPPSTMCSPRSCMRTAPRCSWSRTCWRRRSPTVLCALRPAPRRSTDLVDRSPRAAARALIAGDAELGLEPLPNLMYMRDQSVWLDRGVAVGRMATPARARESRLLHAVYGADPMFATAPRWSDASGRPRWRAGTCSRSAAGAWFWPSRSARRGPAPR